MNAEEFVTTLAGFAPRLRPEKDSEWQRNFVEQSASYYQCRPRPVPLDLHAIDGSESLIDLLNRWDLKGVSTEFLGFGDPLQTGAGLVFGNYINDPLLIRPAGDVVVKCRKTGDVLYEVAEGGDRFLDAFLVAARWVGQYVTDGRASDEDPEGSLAAARECAAAAGGDKYLPFFLHHFPVDDGDEGEYE